MVKGNYKIIYSIVECKLEPKPVDLQWSGQKPGLDYNLLMSHGMFSILADSICGVWEYIRM